MSEKVIDPASLLAQVRKDADPRDRRLFDMRLAEEFEAEQQEAKFAKAASRAKLGPPPDAQLVFNLATQTTGVAVRGAKFICPLPKGYGGPGCELAMIDGNRFIVTQPDRSPLVIDPDTGTTRRL